MTSGSRRMPSTVPKRHWIPQSRGTNMRFIPSDGVFAIDRIGTVMEIRGDSHIGVILWIEAPTQQTYKLKLVDTPRDDIEGYSEEEYSNALDFIRSACPIGSTAYVDLDDDSPKPFRNGPNVGIIWWWAGAVLAQPAAA